MVQWPELKETSTASRLILSGFLLRFNAYPRGFYLLNLSSVPRFSDETLQLAVFCSSQVLKVTIGVPEDEQVSLIGPEFKGKNKWQQTRWQLKCTGENCQDKGKWWPSTMDDAPAALGGGKGGNSNGK